MMAFYKMFYIRHRRTDYHKLWRMMDALMYPEYYEEKKQQLHNAVMRFVIMTNIIHGIGGYGY